MSRKITSSHVYDYKYKLHDSNIVSKETYIDGIFTDAKSFSSDGILLKQMKYVNGNIETIKFLQDEGLKMQEIFLDNNLQERKTFKGKWKSSNLIMKEESNGDIIRYSYTVSGRTCTTCTLQAGQ